MRREAGGGGGRQSGGGRLRTARSTAVRWWGAAWPDVSRRAGSDEGQVRVAPDQARLVTGATSESLERKVASDKALKPVCPVDRSDKHTRLNNFLAEEHSTSEDAHVEKEAQKIALDLSTGTS